MSRITQLISCETCRKFHPLRIGIMDYLAWESGTLIQEAMPYLTADERELLKSRICGACFDEMFSVTSEVK